jgi:hypothetical protein
MARPNQQRATDRQAALAELKAGQLRADRRRRFLIYGISCVVILALAVTVTSLLIAGQQNKVAATAAGTASANKAIKGVQSFTGLTRNHTTAEVPYPQNPPVGGDHAPVWINCGTYTHAVNNWEAVHSLEHGAVWVTYRPDLPKQQVDALAAQAASHPYELLSPYPGLPAPVVATAWGKQLQMDDASDTRLPAFLEKYLQGEQTPEPGAPCSGGIQG